MSAPVPRQRRKEARPQELLDAALTLFVEKGFSATRMEEIATHAGVAKGTVYLYFQSKEDVLKAVIRDSLSSSIAEGRSIVETFEGPSSALVRVAMNLWWERVGETRAGGICKLLIAEAGNFPELAQFFVDEVANPGHALLQQVIQRGIDQGEFRAAVSADYAARVLITPLQFLMIHRNSIGTYTSGGFMAAEPQQFIHTLIDVFLNGLRAVGPSDAVQQERP